ncbi:hypothetical protein [Tautonia plasticadhaerens]|uniref:Uncharacterized protein n=1 Tax=Tautonia plasticadhaerens TaxID=2527974 RepID=A0A518H5Y7_9BACT|nr:hypothetical protein [Tautonia plasticadhaerens]QDV36250.1 hypothetical protein ElP_41690 [Tautonia plasticadhaerens]
MNDPEVGPRERRAVRALFGVVVLGLIAQGAVYFALGEEPYPGIFMPSFHGTGGYTDAGVKSSTYDVDLIADGEVVRTVPFEELMRPIHAPVPGMFAGPFFSPLPEGRTLPQPESELIGGLRYRLLPGLRVGIRRRWTAGNLESLRRWLTGRAEELAPRRAVDWVEIRRSELTIRLVDGEIRRDSEPGGVRAFDLRPGDAR